MLAPAATFLSPAITWSPDLGAPLSTSTKPSPVERAVTFAPPPSITDKVPVSLVADCAFANRGAHNVSAPAAAPLRKFLRSTCRLLYVRDGTSAVAEVILLMPHLLQQGQMQVGDGRALRQRQVLAALLQLAVAAA